MNRLVPNLILTKRKIKAQSILWKFYEQLENLQILLTKQDILFITSHDSSISKLNEWIYCVDLLWFSFVFQKEDLFVFLSGICKEKQNQSQLQINQKHISLFKLDGQDNISGTAKFPVACLLSTLSITSSFFIISVPIFFSCKLT